MNERLRATVVRSAPTGRNIKAQGNALGYKFNWIFALSGRNNTSALRRFRPYRARFLLNRSQGVALGCIVSAFQADGMADITASDFKKSLP
jgi:hypothetical protein